MTSLLRHVSTNVTIKRGNARAHVLFSHASDLDLVIKIDSAIAYLIERMCMNLQCILYICPSIFIIVSLLLLFNKIYPLK